MHTTSLRKVGGSVMLAVPPAVLEILGLQPGEKVGLAIQSGRLVIEPRPRPRYTLNELLAKCSRKMRPGKQDRQWISDKSVGRELL